MRCVGLIIVALCVARCDKAPSVANISVIVDRTIDITSQVVACSVKYQIRNDGDRKVGDVIHLVLERENESLAFIGAKNSGDDESELRVTPTTWDTLPTGFAAYKVKLRKALMPGAEVSLEVEYYLTKYLEPLPAKIAQSMSQFVVYAGNAYAASVYSVAEERTKLQLPKSRLLSYMSIYPTKAEDNAIVYGPYLSVWPFAVADIKVHYENNAPFVVATEIERTIEISHWGNVAVEEKIFLVHKGAILKGPFSRLDFARDHRKSGSFLTHFKTLLPPLARDIYYRDDIGKISSYETRRLDDAVELDLTPRFPLFGGWRIDYTLGYNLPAYQYLFSTGNSFALRIRLLDHLFDNAVVERLTVRVILPEISRKISVSTPYPMRRLPDELHFTYLDTVGRPVIVLQKENLVDVHLQLFTVSYEFDRLLMWREPLLASAAFAVVLLATIGCFRFNLYMSEESS